MVRCPFDGGGSSAPTRVTVRLVGWVLRRAIARDPLCAGALVSAISTPVCRCLGGLKAVRHASG